MVSKSGNEQNPMRERGRVPLIAHVSSVQIHYSQRLTHGEKDVTWFTSERAGERDASQRVTVV